jgi:fucokinase
MNFTFFDPYCCGYKLVGAGGGGFALLFAQKAESGNELKYKLEDSNFNIKVYKLNIHLEN